MRPSDCSELASREGIQNRFLTKTQRGTLDALHQTLPYDPRAQVYIDAYLPCSFLANGALARANPNIRSEQLVLAPGDAPRMGNLPDLGHMIRGALVATLHSRREGYTRRPSGGRAAKRAADTDAGQGRLTGTNQRPGQLIGTNQRPGGQDDMDDRNYAGDSSFGARCIMQCPLWNSRGWPSHAHVKLPQSDRPEQDGPDDRQPKEGTNRRTASKDARWGASKPDTASVFIVLNLTLGSLLGLYPTCQRHPRFATRCGLYRRVHQLLTSDAETLAAFVTQHPHIVRMAVLEHICNMLTLFMPVEAALVQTQFSGEDGYAQCAAAFDAFRRDGIDDGLEPWSVYDAHARTAVEQCTRLMQYKRSDAQHDTWARDEEPVVTSKKVAWGRVLSESDRCARIRCLLNAPARHTESGGASLKGSVLNDLIRFDRLPANLAAMQQTVHDEAMARCEYRGWQRSVRFICFNCEARGVDTKYRVDAPTLEVTCDKECPGCLVGVCTIGNVVTLRGRKYTFAPCCGQVVEYSSAHGEGMWAGRCPNEQPRNEVAPPTRLPAGGRYQCKYCSASSSTLVPYVFPSLKEVRLVSTYLCKKHSPDETAVRYIYNQEDFERVCDEWITQHKPWYRRTCSHRRR